MCKPCARNKLQAICRVLPPGVAIERSRSKGGCAGRLRGRGAGDRAMNAIGVAVGPELSQLPHQIDRVPEEHPVKVLTSDSSDEPCDEGMRNRGVGNRLDLVGLQDAQVGQPAVKADEWVVIGAETFRRS